MEAPHEVRLFDNTRLQDFQTCPMYYYWRHVRHLSSTRPQSALVFGEGIHKALELWYKGEPQDHCFEAFVEIMRPLAQQMAMLQIKDDKRTPENGLAILADYFNTYPRERDVLKPIATEVYFTIAIDETLNYVGKIDLVADWPGYGTAVVDHKTTSMTSSVMQNQANPNRQFTGYIMAAREHYDNVYGAILQQILVHATKRSVSRIPTQRSDVQLAMWILHTKHLVNQIKLCEEECRWPMATNRCLDWNRVCPYAQLCTQPVQPDLVVIHTQDFMVDKWEPGKKKLKEE